jgi:hypothetical protein
MYTQTGMVMESTGGYASSLNGGAESPTKTIKKIARASLIGNNVPDTDCCFALQHSTTTNNQILNRITGKIPAKVLTGKSIPIKHLHPFGARCKVLHNLPTKRTLSARTSGDLREHQPTDYDANAILKSHHSTAYSWVIAIIGALYWLKRKALLHKILIELFVYVIPLSITTAYLQAVQIL